MRTWWHITLPAYGSRLHGDVRPTVDRDHNVPGTPYLAPDPVRNSRERASMRHPPVRFTREQMCFIEDVLPTLCASLGLDLRTSAAGPDHVHVLVGAESRFHGKQVRAVIKRSLTRALDSRWSASTRADGMRWWCEGGSTRPVKDRAYFDNVVRYITRQRATPVVAGAGERTLTRECDGCGVVEAGDGQRRGEDATPRSFELHPVAPHAPTPQAPMPHAPAPHAPVPHAPKPHAPAPRVPAARSDASGSSGPR